MVDKRLKARREALGTGSWGGASLALRGVLVRAGEALRGVEYPTDDIVQRAGLRGAIAGAAVRRARRRGVISGGRGWRLLPSLWLRLHGVAMSRTQTALGYGAMQSVTRGLPSDPHQLLRGWMGAAHGPEVLGWNPPFITTVQCCVNSRFQVWGGTLLQQ
jgi:hypothetical protein